MAIFAASMPKPNATRAPGGRPSALLLLLATGCDLQVILAERTGSTDSDGLGGQSSPSTGGSSGATSAGGTGGGTAAPERPVFSAPRLIEELSTPDAKDQDPTLTGDLLEIFFFSERGDSADLWTSQRASLEADWEAPVPVEELNSAALEINPAVTDDGLELWFHSQRDPPGIYYTRRTTRQEEWEAPEHVAEFGGHIAPAPSADRLRMALSVMDDTQHRDIVESVRPSLTSTWGPLLPIEGLNADADDSTPFLANDGLVIVFSSARTGIGDLYWTYRQDLDGPVAPPESLSELNAADALDTHPHLAPDGTRIFFGSLRSGVADLYEAELLIP